MPLIRERSKLLTLWARTNPRETRKIKSSSSSRKLIAKHSPLTRYERSLITRLVRLVCAGLIGKPGYRNHDISARRFQRRCARPALVRSLISPASSSATFAMPVRMNRPIAPLTSGISQKKTSTPLSSNTPIRRAAPWRGRRRDYDVVVIDGAPRVNELGRAAILASDVVLIPIQPSPYDVWASSDIVQLVKEAQQFKENLKVVFMINRKIANTAISRDVVSAR